ncbi:hypothetical protein OG709_13370 [Streptomyces sp. NBC_01267]|uniref:hypothetical protein n=1 Tax=unclassified Streptomyces TaxID=2593676 RepID=UPI002E320B34|nr:hypothetical protein [Streptomyces sp. NBC_01267]
MATVSPEQPASARPDGFDQEVRDLVEATAPRLFAVVEEFRAGDGDADLDAHVLAWGLAHPDGSADVSAVSGGSRMVLRSPERAVMWFSRLAGGGVRLVWPCAR